MLHSDSSADDGVVLNRRGESRVLCELPKTKPDVLYISNFLNHQQSLREKFFLLLDFLLLEQQ